MKKAQNKNGIIYVAISLVAVLTVGGFIVRAYSGGEPTTVIENQTVAGDYIADSQISEVPGEIVGGMATDVYYPVQFHEGLYTTVSPDIARRASSTLNVASTGDDAVDALAFIYASQDLICDETWLDVKTAVGTGSVGFAFRVGTTTKTAGGSWTNTSTATIIASSTVANTFTSENGGMNSLSNRGLNLLGSGYITTTGTSTLFLLKAGEYLVANYNTINATSSGTFAESNLAGTFHSNCWHR